MFNEQFSKFEKMMRALNIFERLLQLQGQDPRKKKNRHHVSMAKASWKIRAHKRARWELSKLSRRANRG